MSASFAMNFRVQGAFQEVRPRQVPPRIQAAIAPLQPHDARAAARAWSRLLHTQKVRLLEK
jgi:hypothetical protein